MIRLNLVSVGMVEGTASALLVLRAPERRRLLVMEIGMLEGRAIALEAEGVRAPRPLTHDLLSSVIETLGAEVAEVQIHTVREKTFYAYLVLTRAEGDSVAVDARPSDAVALALRAGAPIYVEEAVLEAAGVDEQNADFYEEALELDDEDGKEKPIVH